MSKKLSVYLFLGCVIVLLTNCKSGTSVSIADKQSAWKEGLNNELKVMDVDEQQKMFNSDFQKFAREAEEKTVEVEKSILVLETAPENVGHSSSASQLERVNVLYQRCEDLKVELKEYVKSGDGNWGTFKNEYFRKLNSLKADCI